MFWIGAILLFIFLVGGGMDTGTAVKWVCLYAIFAVGIDIAIFAHRRRKVCEGGSSPSS